MPRYGAPDYVSTGAAMSDALEEFLVNREAQRRQRMIAEINTRHAEQRMAIEQEQLEMQREQNRALAEQRKAAHEANRRKAALDMAAQFAPGDALDAATSGELRDTGYGMLVQSPGTRYTPADAAAAPSQFTSPVLQPEAFTERETFRGTREQLDEQERQRKLAAILPTLPEHVRRLLEAKEAGADVPADAFKTPEAKHSPAYLEYQDYKANGGTLSFDAYMDRDANRKAPRVSVNAGGSGGISPGAATAAGKLADDYRADSKDFISRAESYGTVRAAAKQDSAAGDLSLVFAFMKMLDPGSVVREGEFATAQNAAGIPDRVRNLYNRSLNGTRLAPEQRADFLARAGDIYRTAKERNDRITNQYRERAKTLGVPENLVIMNYGADEPAASGPAAGKPSINIEAARRRYGY